MARQWLCWRMTSALCSAATAFRGLGVAILLTALFLSPVSLGLVTPATPSSSSSTSLSDMLRRMQTLLPSIPRPNKVARDAVYSVLDRASKSPGAVMEQVIDWMPHFDDDVTAADLLRSYGYPAEVHYVWTEDGYRLRIDRAVNEGRQPVFLAHGMQTASPCYVLLGKKSLATMLHDAGFDVWLVNFRGTHYSQKHRNYTVNDEEFWRFSFHEHGVYDNPAAIDYVLDQTGFPSVQYVSHSMGSTSFMIMSAMRPEYQNKILSAHLMAPAGPLHHNRSPFVTVLQTINPVTQSLVDRLRLQHTMRFAYRFLRRLANWLHSIPFLRPLLYAFTFSIVGNQPKAEYYELPHFWNIIPSGGSWGEIFHYEQNAKRGVQGFRQYDFGRARNMKLYGKSDPPLYDLSNIRAPVHFYLAHNDVLCADTDMDYLRAHFGSHVEVYYAQDPTFNHMDFFGSKTADREIYYPMIKHMKRVLEQQVVNDNRLGPDT